MPSISDIILYAKVSQAFAACDINNQKYLKGGAIDEYLPRLIYIVRKDVEYLYSINPADLTLTDTANYLYSLCGQYGLQVQYSTGNQAGIILPTPVVNTLYTSVRIPSSPAAPLMIPFSYPTINLGNSVTDGTTVIEIRDAGIQEDSFRFLRNSQNVDEGLSDQFSYTHTYINNVFSLFLNQGLSSGDRVEFRYGKTTTV